MWSIAWVVVWLVSGCGYKETPEGGFVNSGGGWPPHEQPARPSVERAGLLSHTRAHQRSTAAAHHKSHKGNLAPQSFHPFDLKFEFVVFEKKIIWRDNTVLCSPYK